MISIHSLQNSTKRIFGYQFKYQPQIQRKDESYVKFKRKKQKVKSAKGITLVVLVITIIILLILATISIQKLTNTGLFAKAKETRDKTANAEENQARTLNEYEDELNKYISGDIKTTVKKVANNIGSVLSTTDNTELV